MEIVGDALMGFTSAITVPLRKTFVVVVLEKVFNWLLPVPAKPLVMESMAILVVFDD
jgi:hypothetical protein